MSSLAQTFGNNTTIGNTIIVTVTTGTTVSSVTDTQGNTFTQAAVVASGTSGQDSIWYAANIQGGVDTITANFSGSTPWSVLYIHEYSGIAAASSLDQTGSAMGSGTVVSTNNVTTTQPSELIFGYADVAHYVSAAGSGFTTRQTTGGNMSEETIVFTMGSYAAGFAQQFGTSLKWTALITTFKAASTGPPPTLQSITMTPANPTVSVGGTPLQLTAAGTYSDSSMQNVTNSCAWTSGATAVATVSSSGQVTGIAIGSANITCTIGSVGGFATVTVTAGTMSIRYIQSTGTFLFANASSISQSFAANTTAGDTIVVGLSTDGPPGPAITSVMDTQGNTYAQATALNGAAIWYAKNIVGGADQVTASFASTTGFSVIYIHEYAGLDTSTPLDQLSSQSGSGTAVSSVARATTSANELIFGYAAVDHSVSAAGSGFTARQTTGGNMSEDMIVSTTGSYAASFTQKSGGNVGWVGLMATFKAAPTGPPPTLQSISVTPANPTASVGGPPLQLSATGTYSDSSMQNVTNSCAWTSSATEVATVSSSGEVTPVAVGSANTTCAIGSVNGFTTMTVAVGTMSIRYVQSAGTYSQSAASALAQTFDNSTTTGNTIIVTVTTGTTVSSVTDTQGNTFTQAAVVASGTSGQDSIWYAANIQGGVDTITANFSGSTPWSVLYIHEYSGIAAASSLDQTGSAMGSGTAVSTNNVTTIQPSELIFGYADVAHDVSAGGKGFSLRQSIGGNGSEDTIASSTGSYAVTFTQANGSSLDWTALIATFEAASGGSGGGSGPSISSFSPSAGPVTTMVTITGSNFGSSQDVSTVTFNNMQAGTASAWSPTSITVNVPSGATTGQVVVTVAGIASNTQTFTVDPVIATQPISKIVNLGSSAILIVSATGNSALSYQWQENGMNISGATAAIYRTPPTTAADNQSTFQVVVTDSAGSASSNAVALTVNPGTAVPEYSIYEIPLTASNPYTNAYTQVSVTGIFTPPATCAGVQAKSVPGFWEGPDQTQFIVRFAPTCTGTWTYSISSTPSDPGLSVSSGSLNVVAPNSNEHGFVRRDPANPYHFVYDDGAHYFMMGQTYYNIIENVAGGGTWQTAIRQTAASGFTKIRILLYSWGLPVYNSSGSQYNDIIPFATCSSSVTHSSYHDQINPTFWDDLDALVGYMHDQGIIADVILFNDDESSYGETGICGSTNGRIQNERYIQYAVARLAGQTNVIWCMANEYDYVADDPGTEHAATNNGYSDNGTGYTAADAHMNDLGTALHTGGSNLTSLPDPYFNSDSIPSAPRILSVHQHSQPSPFLFLWWNLANTLGANWFTSAIVQQHIGGSQPYGDQIGNESIVNNVTLGHNIPVVNGEYGYLDTQSNTRTVARNSIWSIVVGGGYGSFGGDCGSGECAAGTPADMPIFSGDWIPRSYYSDISILTQFMNTTAYWQRTTANSKIAAANGARVYASGPVPPSTSEYVIYVAQSAASGPSFMFNESSSSSCTTVDQVDPRTGNVLHLGPSLSGPISITTPDATNDYVYHLTGNTCGQ